MSLAALCLALITQGTVPGIAESASSPTAVGYRVRVVEMEGLKWRAEVHRHLRPVARQGGASVWLMDESVVGGLLDTSKQTLFTPKAASGREIPAEMRTSLRVPYVANIERVADGPHGHATALAYKPDVAYVDESLSVSVKCRPASEGGAMATISLDETRLAALELVEVVEDVQPKADAEPGTKPVTLKAHMQVPLLVDGTLKGEWRVPEGQALVVGLGPHEMKRADGTIKVTERVAVIDPDQCTPAAVAVAAKRTKIVAPPADYGAARVGLALPPLPQSPAPIAESGRWNPRRPQNVAMRANTPSREHAGLAMVSPALTGASVQPVVIQSRGQGPTIIIIPGNGSVNVMTPDADMLAMVPRGEAAMPVGMGMVDPMMAAEPMLPPAAPVAAMPAMPSRSLPTPRNSLGEEIPLPPLPMAEAYVPDDGSGEIRATPQTTADPYAGEEPEEEAYPEADEAGEALDQVVWTSPATHVALALGAISDCMEAEDCDSPFCCHKSEIVLGATPANGWRSASELTSERDETVERTAMLPEHHGRISVTLGASSSALHAIPSVTTTKSMKRVGFPLGIFRIQVEVQETTQTDTHEAPTVDGQP